MGPMDHPWVYSLGLWVTRELPTALPLVDVADPWVSHGFPMDFFGGGPWVSHVSPMNLAHGLPMGYPWV